LVSLSTNNIRKLLSEVASALLEHDRQFLASALLARLTEISPGVANRFHLKQQDPVNGIPLRMVCSSRLACVPSFVAVSYCWHYPTWSPSPHAAPIAPGWGISKPMVQAIMQLRQSEEEGVWMDRLCINQADLSEKVSHVGAMNIIYRSARRILILLEDVQLTAAEAEAGTAYAGFFADMCRVVERERLEGTAKAEFVNSYFPQQEDLLRQRDGGHHLSAVKSFAMRMLGARWYSRAWCAHESRTARHAKVNNPLLLCYGHNGAVLSFEFRFIYYLSYYLCRSEPPEPVGGAALAAAMGDPNPATLRHLWWRMTRLMPDAVSSRSPMQHLVSILSFGCKFKGDLVSIALNTWELPLLYDGVISTVEDAIVTFSLLTIASGDLTPLIMSGSKLRVQGGSTGSEMDSWLVRPTQGVLGSPLTGLVPESITSVTEEYIDLD
ncbi:heterokaryon incompatibility protein-domain-containing protein, partial [Coniochaeta sp. 2T2.1]